MSSGLELLAHSINTFSREVEALWLDIAANLRATAARNLLSRSFKVKTVIQYISIY